MASPTYIVNLPKMLPEAYVKANLLARQLAEKYRELRLHALRVAPEAFASSYEQEAERDIDYTLERLKTTEADHFFALDRDIRRAPAQSTEQFYQNLLKAELLGMIVLIGPVRASDITARNDPLERTDPGQTGNHASIVHYHLNGMFVAPKCRRSGLGEALIRAALGKRQHERRKISILVDSENERARKLYEKVGFVVTEQERYLQQPRSLLGKEEAGERVALRLEIELPSSTSSSQVA